MRFEELLIFSVISYSITFGYMESPLFTGLKSWVRKHIHRAYGDCYHCAGFWIAFVVALLFFDAGWGAVLWALFGSGAIVVCDKIVTFLHYVAIPWEIRYDRWTEDHKK